MKVWDGEMAAADDLLDPQMRWFLDRVALAARGLPDPLSVPIADARRVIEQTLLPFAEGGPRIGYADELVPTAGRGRMRVRRYGGDAVGAACLVYVHGGGWTWESIETHDRMAREYAARVGCEVLVPDYALAPEHPFPTAVEEIVELLEGLHRSGKDVMFVGDSAGANLAILACMRLAGSSAQPRAALLNYGAFSRDFDRPSYDRMEASTLGPKRAQIAWFWNNYVGAAKGDPAAAEPLRGELAGLPPLRLQVAQLDVLHDENIALADAAVAVGVDVECTVYPSVTHGFLRAVGHVEAAGQAFDNGCRWLSARA